MVSKRDDFLKLVKSFLCMDIGLPKTLFSICDAIAASIRTKTMTCITKKSKLLEYIIELSRHYYNKRCQKQRLFINARTNYCTDCDVMQMLHADQKHREGNISKY